MRVKGTEVSKRAVELNVHPKDLVAALEDRLWSIVGKPQDATFIDHSGYWLCVQPAFGAFRSRQASDEERELWYAIKTIKKHLTSAG